MAKRLVPAQQFEAAPSAAKHLLVSDANRNYQHAPVTSITDPIIARINEVEASAKNAVMDVVYNDRVLTQAEIDADSYTFRLTPRVPLTLPVEVTVADANGQTGIVVTHDVTGFGPATPAGQHGAYDVMVTGFADELAVGGTLGILTTWKLVIPEDLPVPN